MGRIRPVIDEKCSQVQLLCPGSRVATVAAGQALCPRCGAHVKLDDLLEQLHQCRKSLDDLIEAVEGEL